ncbi:phosphoglycerate mutase family protein [Mycobacterium sp.]|uniref:phosphoglycerate mutase family protein n=1 Tax=Mycobacterium sp. TaxID=1785 RepID=UPI003BAFAFCE
MRLRYCSYVTAGIAVIGASVIAVAPTTATTAPRSVYAPDMQLTAGDDTDVVIDVVRHAQMISPFEDELTPSPAFPGAPLSDLGQQQAQDVGNQLFNQLGQHVAGIFEGQGLREMETAAPFAGLENMSDNVQILPGLDEIDSGIYALDPIDSTGGQLAFLTAGAWSLGAPFGLALLQAPGSSDVNGVVFDQRFTDAIDTMYGDAIANPVVSDNGHITDVAFNSEASIFVWALMNVKNPDIPFFIQRIIEAHTVPDGLSTVLLPNTGVVQIEGNPTDGWTLVSWDGQAIPQNPDLLSSLFVDLRDVALPEQTAEWNIWEAILGGDSTTIMNAVQTGFDQVDTALAQFPESVINSIEDAVTNAVATEAGATLSDVLASWF